MGPLLGSDEAFSGPGTGQREPDPSMSEALRWKPTGNPGRTSGPGTDLSVVRKVYEEHASWARAALTRLAGPELDADDLLHEVFLVALRRREVFEREGEPRAWLYGVAVKTVQNARRRARVRRWLGLEAAADVEDPQRPDGAAQRSEAKRRVYAALEPLTEKKRTVFVLFELEGLSGEEIASVLEIPVKTVWTRLHHARKEFERNLRLSGDERGS